MTLLLIFTLVIYGQAHGGTITRPTPIQIDKPKPKRKDSMSKEEIEKVNKSIREAKNLIAQKDYSKAKSHLEKIKAIGNLKDTVNFYLSLTNYHLKLEDYQNSINKLEIEKAYGIITDVLNTYSSDRSTVEKLFLNCKKLMDIKDRSDKILPALAEAIRIIDPDSLDHICDGLIPFKKRELWGVMNLEGKVVVPALYDEIRIIYERRGFEVRQKNEWGVIDSLGLQLMPFMNGIEQPSIPSQCLNCFAIQKVKGKYALFSKGKFVTDFIYDDLHSAEKEDDLIPALIKGMGWGYINTKGKTIIPHSYDEVSEFSENVAWVVKNGNNYIINKSGKVISNIVNLPAQETPECNDGLFLVQDSRGKYGFVDKTGKIAIKCIYDNAFDFDNGLTIVKKGKKEQIINTSGQMAIQTDEYDWIFLWPDYIDVRKDIVISEKDKQSYFGRISRNGDVIIPIKLTSFVNDIYANTIIVSIEGFDDGEFRLYNVNGECIKTLLFDDIQLNGVKNDESNFCYPVKRSGIWGVVDIFGRTSFDYHK